MAKFAMSTREYIVKRIQALTAEKGVIDAKLDELALVFDSIEREEGEELARNKALSGGGAPF